MPVAIEYLGLSEINGPLIVLEGVQDAFYEEVVEFVDIVPWIFPSTWIHRQAVDIPDHFWVNLAKTP